VRRALLVSHRSPAQAGGGAARWRSLIQRLPDHGWQVDIISAPERASATELAAGGSPAAQRRASVMGRVGRLADPVFGLAGLRPDALPPSMLWIPRGARATRRAARGTRRAARGDYDLVVATGPPMAGLLAGRLGVRGLDVPLVVELRDLWARSPAFDRGGPILPALERRVVSRAARVVAMTPEAASDLRARHPYCGERIVEIPNGYEPELLAGRDGTRAHAPGRPLTILHSGAITPDRPLAPIVSAMAGDDRFRLVLHGFVHPEVLASVSHCEHVEVLPASDWEEATRRMRTADALLVTQARGAGDATAVASKVYEYLAVGRPVLCVTDGGATERLLRRLGHDTLCARLDDPPGIRASLDRLAASPPPPVTTERLAPYSRAQIAIDTAALLDEVASAHRGPPARRTSRSPHSEW